MRIGSVKCKFEKEPLLAPFGFKGGYLTELWQSAVLFEEQQGQLGLGLGTQSVLWSDGQVFTSFPEAVGNAMMFQTTVYAAEKAMGVDWETPIELLEILLPDTYAFAKRITQSPNLRLTFALNALVAVDNAAWMLYGRTKAIKNFDELIPAPFRPALACHQDRLACIPLITYKVPVCDVVQIVNEGHCLLKIKIGADPAGDGDPEKMLQWDMARLSEVHQAIKHKRTPHTDCGNILYYLDANGRYDSKERLLKLINLAAMIGAGERVILLEEPFPEGMEVDLSGIPVRLVADESAHSDKEAIKLMQMGYRALALKPIAKTLSMSLKIAKLAHERNIPCFCADLTVNPILVEWNKNVAARLPAFPGLKVGVIESNGHQNYKNWESMKTRHPFAGASWTHIEAGLFLLDEDFYAKSGGIFEASGHYASLAITDHR